MRAELHESSRNLSEDARLARRPPRITFPPQPPRPVTPERYQLVKSAFRLALDAPPSKRNTILRELRAADPALHAEITALLRSDAAPATAIDTPAVGAQFRLRARSLSYSATRR